MLIKDNLKKLRNIFFRKGFGNKKWQECFGYFGKEALIEYPSILQEPSRIFIGDGTIIMKNSRIQNYDGKSNKADGIFIGNGCFLGFNLTLLNSGKIVIGDSVLMASNILISSENHGMNPESEIPYMDQPLISNDVEISDGVWIGQNVCILPGVHIGKKSIIGAGSIVSKSIPDYSIAVGNPAKVIKKYNFNIHKWENT